MTFRGLAAVNGLRPPEAARDTRAIDSRETSETRGFHEVDGARCRTAAPMPRTINLCEAKTRLSALVDAAERGEEIVIAKNGLLR